MATLTACTNNDDIAGAGGVVSNEDGNPMAFSTYVAPVTRADGKTAADSLGSNFYVYAIKNEGTGLAGNIVCNNYKVTYTDGTTSTSNAAGWEYVGIAKDKEADYILEPVIDATSGQYTSGKTTTTTQTIKYWDPKANNYTFYAFADGGNDLISGNITVTKLTPGTPAKRYSNGYTVEIKKEANPSKLYFSNREYIAQSNNTDATADNTYNGKVKLTFHNALAKVRVGMYETIPGYSVTIDGFEVADDNDNPAFGDMTSKKTDKFSANLTNNTVGDAGTLKVTYSGTIVDEGVMPTTSESNAPSIAFSSDKKNSVLTLGDNLKKDKELQTSSATAVYDHSDKSYNTVYPQGDNKNTMKLKVDYTLKSKAGETIEVKGATAEVPAEYLQWKPGYAYTYIFKISDQTNGVIGALTGLHPITLDAVTVSDGAGSEEVISTTSQGKVNILTVGYNAKTNLATVGADDYNIGDEIYASVYDTNNTATLTDSNTKLYSVTTDDASNYPITAATVKTYLEAVANNSTLINQHVTAWSETGNIVNEVPGSNGMKYAISAMKWTAENRVYAVEYTYSGSDTKTSTKTYKIVKVNGNNGLTKGTLTLDKTTVTNAGGKIYPSLNVDGVDIADSSITFALDTNGEAGAKVPTTVTVETDADGKTYINVPGSTTPTKDKAYHVTATYRGRTYTAAFNVEQ